MESKEKKEEKLSQEELTKLAHKFANKIDGGPLLEVAHTPNLSVTEKRDVMFTALSIVLAKVTRTFIDIGQIKKEDARTLLQEFTDLTIDGVNEMLKHDFEKKVMSRNMGMVR